MPAGKYPVPRFLSGVLSRAEYGRWLHRKAQAHVRRDRARGARHASVAAYKSAIHDAVKEAGTRDFYTGRRLDWSLVSRYDNGQAKRGGRQYKEKFADLPTVDHVHEPGATLRLVICAWRTNDAKSDLSYADFVQLCKRVLHHSAAVRRSGTGRGRYGPAT